MKRFIAIIMTLCMVLGMSSIGAFGAEEGWKEQTVMPTKKTEFGACAIGDKIYIIGGKLSSEGESNSVEIYDLKTKEWTLGEPMPTARRQMDTAVYGQKIYVLGGYGKDGAGNAKNKMEIYDTETNTWEIVKEIPFDVIDSVYVSKVINEKIYLISSNSGLFVDIYDIKTKTWDKGKSMPNAIESIKGVIKGNSIYVFVTLPYEDRTKIAIYNTETDTWETGSPLAISIGDTGIEIVGSKIYLMGGWNFRTEKGLNSVNIYDTETNTWSIGTSLITTRCCAKSAVIGETIYIIGGSTPKVVLDTVDSLHVGTQTTTIKLSVLLNTGETVQLSTSHNLADNANYTWSSTNEAVATVDANGKVTAVAVGEADIYAQNADGTFKEYIPVKVVEGIADELRLAVHLKAGEKAKLYLTDNPSEVTWSSMDESVATVSSDGQVIAVKKGLAIIQGELAGQTYQIYVRVNG